MSCTGGWRPGRRRAVAASRCRARAAGDRVGATGRSTDDLEHGRAFASWLVAAIAAGVDRRDGTNAMAGRSVDLTSGLRHRAGGTAHPRLAALPALRIRYMNERFRLAR